MNLHRGGERLNLEEYVMTSTGKNIQETREWLAEIERQAWQELGRQKRERAN